MSELEMSDWRMRNSLYEERTGKTIESILNFYPLLSETLGFLGVLSLTAYCVNESLEAWCADPNYCALRYGAATIIGIISGTAVREKASGLGKKVAMMRISSVLEK